MQLNCDDFQKLRFNLLTDAGSVNEEEVKQLEEHLASCPCQREICDRGIKRLMEDVGMGD